ncbi:MAG: WYL domain-containing protein [Candidatus Nanopelagicaceae bacterium]|nr:WYL domain-containing protein [Candidatus Nanopelagicaceae bacterium]
MSQAKTERLVNLTMALLASRRYMKKSEIFDKVAGYSGSAETKERMFERDKDDLRNLGIEIEVASQDPLFEDEAGYRIKPESYRFPLKNLSDTEKNILATALALWESSGFEKLAAGTSRRLLSKANLDETELTPFVLPVELVEESLTEIAKALALRSAIEFQYQKPDSQSSELRTVHPMGLSTWRGSWYLVGEDLGRKDIRAFKLSRICSQIFISKKREMYEIPDDFSVSDYLVMLNRELVEIEWLVRKGRAQLLRSHMKMEKSFDEEWDLILTEEDSVDLAVEKALWHFDSVVLNRPKEARERVINRLQELSEQHE